jgi:hypothetical protein
MDYLLNDSILPLILDEPNFNKIHPLDGIQIDDLETKTSINLLLKGSKSNDTLIYKPKFLNTNIDMTKKIYYIFDQLKKIIPPKTKSMDFLDELIHNKTHKIYNCCNPDCQKEIYNKYYYGFDGYYCSHDCRNMASQYISTYWNKL